MARITLLLIWIAALYGVLQSGPYLGDLGHSICGPWGCGPPLESLIVYHGFWLVLVGGLTIAAIQFCSAATLRGVGRTLVALGICALFGLAAWELAHMTAAMRPYAVRRYFFALVTLVDVPIVPATLAGIACSVASYRKKPDPSAGCGYDMASDVAL